MTPKKRVLLQLFAHYGVGLPVGVFYLFLEELTPLVLHLLVFLDGLGDPQLQFPPPPLLYSSSSRFTVLFSHGNAVDLGQMSSFYIGLGTRINCNIFSYDYSGYGVSTGKPSEKNLYADIDAAWHALRSR